VSVLTHNWLNDCKRPKFPSSAKPGLGSRLVSWTRPRDWCRNVVFAGRSVAEKRRIVELTLAPGASVALVARAHGVNANQVFSKRPEFPSGVNRRGVLEVST
jgi:hypothetical protein